MCGLCFENKLNSQENGECSPLAADGPPFKSTTEPLRLGCAFELCRCVWIEAKHAAQSFLCHKLWRASGFR